MGSDVARQRLAVIFFAKAKSFKGERGLKLKDGGYHLVGIGA